MNSNISSLTLLKLNTQSKMYILADIKKIIDIITSIFLFNSPNKSYILELVSIIIELIKIVTQENDDNFPTLKCDKNFINILNRFNELQKQQEIYRKTEIDRVYEEPTNSDDTIKTN